MNFSTHLDWRKIFYLDVPLLEILLRGSIIYLSLFFMLRFAAKREAGAMGITDMLVLVLLADAAQNAMSAGYHSVTDGLLLVSTIILWSIILNLLGFTSKKIEKIIKPPKLLLIKNGRIQRKNLSKELLTEEELMSEMRRQGITDIREITQAYIESDGSVSIISQKEKERSTQYHEKKERI